MRTIFEHGGFRIIEHQDTHFDFEDLCGDNYNPKHHPDIEPEILASQLSEFTDLVNSEGVFGYVLERWNPEIDAGWEEIDSCWGFIGSYDPAPNNGFDHYIVDEMKSIIAEESRTS